MNPCLDQISIDVFRQNLLTWYDQSGRDLPWRVKGGRVKGGLGDPYRIWLSEVMLQQTTVAHVIPYFEAFTKLWPRLSDLAAADEASVMARWAGLGYYARARRLLGCAHLLMRDYKGLFPTSEAELLKLPGFGPYTAAAVSAFAFGQATNVVDGNIERIMARFYAVDQLMPVAKTLLRDRAGLWVRAERASDWPQSLMDLASLVCRPKAPLCGQCPLSAGCAAYRQGTPDLYPRKAVKAAKPQRYGAVFVVSDGARLVVERRLDKGLLGGMLGLPHLLWRDQPWSDAEAINQRLTDAYIEKAYTYDHVFTHFALTQVVWRQSLHPAQFDSFLRQNPHYQALNLAETSALPTVFKKALKFLA
jgi:A/G-specific adenine glycosylase